MSKYFILSFDDGTIYDRGLVDLLNKYNIPGTFNLNTGLEDFVWYFDGKPVERLKLYENRALYNGHEIASHSAHHPCLTELADWQFYEEVGQDCRILKDIFGKDQLGFAVPFTACGEREVNLIRPYVRYLRLSAFQDGFSFPADPYHIYINGLYNDPDIREKILAFAQDPRPEGLFVLCGHSYELEMLDHWEYMEDLLQYIRSFGFTHLTTMEFVQKFFPDITND